MSKATAKGNLISAQYTLQKYLGKMLFREHFPLKHTRVASDTWESKQSQAEKAKTSQNELF